MKYIYHYHAMVEQGVVVKQMVHMDGVVVRENTVTSIEDFRELKRAIAEYHHVPMYGLTMCNLSFLGTKEG